MKHLALLFFLVCSFCHAQQTYDNTRVTAYRLINTFKNGPCTIKGYMKQEERLGYYIQAVQSTDNKLAYDLLRLKKEAKETWKKDSLTCGVKITRREIAPNAFMNEEKQYGTVLPNMFVVEVNRFRDTIYTTANNLSIAFPEEQTQFIDDKKQLDAAFTDDFRKFFTRDLTAELAANVSDSIPYGRLLINEKKLYKHTRKSFERDITKFQVVRTDSVFGQLTTIETEYWLNNIRIKFSNQNKQITELKATKMNYNFPNAAVFEVDGIKIGDSEEMLYECYPNSTKFKNWGASVNDITNNYYYDVQLIGTDGYIMFYIKDKVINEIEVSF
jgi:hypothetical protein